jgi:hypothetical protein
VFNRKVRRTLSQNQEEFIYNTSLTLPAALIVVLISLLSGVGNWLFNGLLGGGTTIARGFLGSLIGVFVGWFIWSIATWFVGTRLFKVKPTWVSCCV